MSEKPKKLYDPEAERALLGTLLLDPSTLDLPEVARIGRPSFHTEFYGAAFECAQEHYRSGRIPDLALLSSDLEALGAHDAFGKLAGIVADDRPNLMNAPEYARRVFECAGRRRSERRLLDALNAVYNRNGDWSEYEVGPGVTLAMLDERGKAENVNRPDRKTTWTAAELLTTRFERPPFIVDGLLSAGLTFLAGAPKIGKSVMALQLTQAVSTGGVFLSQRVARGPCLYLALEDPEWRLAERMQAQRWEDTSAHADFWTVGSLTAGGGGQLAEIIRQRAYKLVVIDTLSRALAGDQNDSQVMNAALQPIQVAAHDTGTAVLLVDHFNKLGAATSGASDDDDDAPDPIVNLAGAIAKGGVADCIMGLYRNRGKRGYSLSVKGRDVEEQTLRLKRDPLTKTWQLAEEAEARQLSTARAEILDAIASLGGEASYPEVTKAIPKNRGNVYKQLQDLVNLGYLVYSGKRYALGSEEAEEAR